MIFISLRKLPTTATIIRADITETYSKSCGYSAAFVFEKNTAKPHIAVENNAVHNIWTPPKFSQKV